MTEPDRRDDAARALGVTSANWLDAPYNRLGFRRVGMLARTARISRGDGPVSELPGTSATSAASASSTRAARSISGRCSPRPARTASSSSTTASW